MATTSSARVLPTPDESVANQLFLTNFFCHNIFFLSKLLPREKKYFLAKKLVGNTLVRGWQHSRRRECCQPIFLPKNIFFLVTTISRKKNLGQKNFWQKKLVGNTLVRVGNTLVRGWQHSRRGSTMMSTTSIGCQIHSFDATKMVCTKK